VIQTLQVALRTEEKGFFEWVARSGKTNRFDLGGSWKTVTSALTISVPDTSWMDEPLQREGFMSWL
jgi:hypothetical protein